MLRIIVVSCLYIDILSVLNNLVVLPGNGLMQACLDITEGGSDLDL